MAITEALESDTIRAKPSSMRTSLEQIVQGFEGQHLSEDKAVRALLESQLSNVTFEFQDPLTVAVSQ
jgi:hypothetical protein